MTAAISSLLLAYVTAPASAAEPLARALVEARVAACVNLLPAVRSVYRWQGQVETADEVLLVCKTTEAAWTAFESLVRERHPYELPEIVAVPMARVEARYRDWVISEVPC